MPYISSTPEALAARLIGRSDSRNPATTCRGISISTGKPCRRSIASKAPSGYKKSSNGNNDKEQTTEEVNPAEEFFCWQHKDQAADTVVLHRSESQKMRRLEGRSSLDTLVEVILGVEAGENAGEGAGPGQAEVTMRRETLIGDDEVMVVRKNTVVKKDAKIVKEAKKKGEGKKAVWDALHGHNHGSIQSHGRPVSQLPSGGPPKRTSNRLSTQSMGRIQETPGDTYPPNNELKPSQRPRPTTHRPNGRPSLLAQLFCCIADDDYRTPPARPHSQIHQQQPQMQSTRPRPVSQQPPLQQNAAPYPNFKPHNQPPPVQQPQESKPIAPYLHSVPPAEPAAAHIKFQRPAIVPPAHPTTHAIFPPNIHHPNGWDDPELISSSDSEDDSDDETQTVDIPVETIHSLNPILPSHLSAKTRALITTEMNKPISQKDMPGYIYIFWLKDESAAPPLPDRAGAAIGETIRGIPILAPPTVTPAQQAIKQNRQYSYIKDPGSAALFRAVDDDYSDDDEAISPTANRRSRGSSLSASGREKRVLLKIGRAQNVQRRLHQWSQQCGYNLQLLRYYPYVPLGNNGVPSGNAAATMGNGKPAQKVPFSHRVERLIHLELRDDYYNKPHVCETCQRVHKEWFAVPGNREGVKRVDEVIKRWCRWAEGVEGAVNKRQSWGIAASLGHRRDNSGGSAATGFLGEGEDGKDDRKVTGGVRGVERMVWREGYVEEAKEEDEFDEEEETRRKRMERMDRNGTFGFL
ncbi:hypothetical protein H072_7895 [Dactylellina haptotyla CBS 200.50]|uniref:Bacteriophage T5 Orf172 DNA-binding domain-containing protein n=1 Tax=Dactylellina haptotyla (strain CBS 200.50) TaxID=1284197 RepID=S8A6F9_DACHA|nr:hypothetical protein H072_7895 [Dactylellina haptotyla CBS 200.50]